MQRHDTIGLLWRRGNRTSLLGDPLRKGSSLYSAGRQCIVMGKCIATLPASHHLMKQINHGLHMAMPGRWVLYLGGQEVTSSVLLLVHTSLHNQHTKFSQPYLMPVMPVFPLGFHDYHCWLLRRYTHGCSGTPGRSGVRHWVTNGIPSGSYSDNTAGGGIVKRCLVGRAHTNRLTWIREGHLLSWIRRWIYPIGHHGRADGRGA